MKIDVNIIFLLADFFFILYFLIVTGVLFYIRVSLFGWSHGTYHLWLKQALSVRETTNTEIDPEINEHYLEAARHPLSIRIVRQQLLEHSQQILMSQSWTSTDIQVIELGKQREIVERFWRTRQVWGITSTNFPWRLQLKDQPESYWGCESTMSCVSTSEPSNGTTHIFRNLNDDLSQDIELDLTPWKSNLDDSATQRYQEKSESAHVEPEFNIFINVDCPLLEDIQRQ